MALGPLEAATPVEVGVDDRVGSDAAVEVLERVDPLDVSAALEDVAEELVELYVADELDDAL